MGFSVLFFVFTDVSCAASFLPSSRYFCLFYCFLLALQESEAARYGIGSFDSPDFTALLLTGCLVLSGVQ